MNLFENVSSTVGRLLVLPLFLALVVLAPAQSPPSPTGFTLDGGTPTGGACVNAAPAPTTYSYNNGTYGGTSNSSGTAMCSGQTNWDWTWQGPGPAPASVVLRVDSHAQWSVPPGSCDDGLGQDDPKQNTYYGPTLFGQQQNGTAYVVKNVGPGGTVHYEISPNASATHSTCNVSVTVALTPVTIESNYAVRDGDTFNFLVGQQADFYVSAGGYQLDQYNWQSGGSCVAEVRFGQQGSFSGYSPRPYYDSRETIRDEGQFLQAHPSWYYDGDDHDGNVSCSVRIRVSGTVIGTVSLSHPLHVWRPIVDLQTSTTGPSTINDPDPTTRGDAENARAGSLSPLQVGMAHYARVKLPPLFVQAQGLGQWSYVQLVYDTIHRGSYTTNDTYDQEFPNGLDATYPYGGFILESSSQQDWCDTTWAYTLRFDDSPQHSIGGWDVTNRDFGATTFMALRPPVYQGQGRVDMPIEKATWTYGMNSYRDSATTRWYNPNAYTQAGSGWETTPAGPGVSLTSDMQEDDYSEDMDWHVAND